MGQAERQPLRAVSLDDKYTHDHTSAYMTGIEALVRLPMLQRARDVKRGLNTAGFVSGYRGSPLGGVCLLYTSPSPRDRTRSRMPSSA